MVQFIKEPNNLCNVNTFKHFGLATKKTISVQAGKDSGIVLATIKTNKQKYPSALVHKTVMKQRKYLVFSRFYGVKEKNSERVLEILVLPGDYVPPLLLDIGCGSGLSGETLSESGHQWIGLDISNSMLSEIMLRWSGKTWVMDGVINGAISISVVQVMTTFVPPPPASTYVVKSSNVVFELLPKSKGTI
ncbi:hypothetical protein MKW98_012083 [Papaver atlanticum]|uniref:Uncharacterized protein n=1 Tax=Papaver atlanticum TaxID=357466 RepID=A0AAD4XXQ8_9MAGN|nr:hypothetical protein MKW98_012083 [Papaver atlanticum]